MNRSRTLWLASLAFVCAGSASITAQEVPSVFGVDVRLVAVPAFVTDKDGKAVPGLLAEDFEIEEGGRKVPVAGFLAVDAGAGSGDAALHREASPRLTAAARRQFVLLFDLTFSSPAGILKARRAAIEFLENGPQPGDLVAVAKAGAGGLQILVGFTPDRAQAASAVAMLETTGAERVRDPLGLAYDLGFILKDDTGKFGVQLAQTLPQDPDDKTTLLQMLRDNQDQYRQRVAAYVGELQGLAELLDSVHGRKQVVLLSAGFDQSMLLGAEGAERVESSQSVVEGRLWDVQGDRHFGDAQTRSGLDGLFTALARTDTVIHTVDVTGIAAGGALDERGSVSGASGRESLAQIAGRSGGRFVRETNDLAGALREVLDASRHYYVLAFEPAGSKKKPGELHKLKVKVKRPGLTVSHRAGYVVRDPKATPASVTQLQSAEVIAKGLSGGALRLQALAVPYRGLRGEVSLPVVLEIEGESLLAHAGKKALSLEVFGYCLDPDGRIQDAFTLTPTLDLGQVSPALKQKGLQILTAFRARPGPADLRFLVRDPASGQAGSLRLTATVPSFEAGSQSVSPPLIMDDPRARVVLPAASRANPRIEIPFRLQDTAFTPQAFPLLRNGETREVCVMAFGGPATGTAATLTATLIREDGQSLPLELASPRDVNDADRFRRLVVSLTPKGVPAGAYRLRLDLPGSSGDEGRSELPIRVQ